MSSNRYGRRISAFGPGAAPGGDAGDGSPTNTRPKILAICGAKSNNVVTEMQLKNLHIT